jgi:hypothetical protein
MDCLIAFTTKKTLVKSEARKSRGNPVAAWIATPLKLLAMTMGLIGASSS